LAQIPFLKSLGLPHRSPNRFSPPTTVSLSTHLSTLLSTYISSLRSSLTCHPTTNNWDGNYKFGIFGSCEIIFARLDFDFATASKMITFLRFLLPAYFFSAILQHQLHGKQNDGKDGNTCLLPHASQLRGERSSLQLLLLHLPTTQASGLLPTCHMRCKVPLQLLLLLLLLIMGSSLRGKRFSKVLHQ